MLSAVSTSCQSTPYPIALHIASVSERRAKGVPVRHPFVACLGHYAFFRSLAGINELGVSGIQLLLLCLAFFLAKALVECRFDVGDDIHEF